MPPRTHCSRGHEYTPENTKIEHGRVKSCRICVRMHERARRAAKRGAAPDRSPNMEKILSRVEFELNTGCWLWSGCQSGLEGYGSVRFDYRLYRVHRLTYELTCGPIPDGMVVCHRCDTPACVNPAHLFVGTHAQNAADRDAKGRQNPARGERSASARLTEDDVRKIRALQGTASQDSIGKRFGVTQTSVSCIQRRHAWKHIA